MVTAMAEDGNLDACSRQFLSIEVTRPDGSGMRTLWQAARLRHERVALAPPDQAPVEPEHPACPGRRRWEPPPYQRLHVVHPSGKDREAFPPAAAAGRDYLFLSPASGANTTLS
jgi:hypothetical protein